MHEDIYEEVAVSAASLLESRTWRHISFQQDRNTTNDKDNLFVKLRSNVIDVKNIMKSRLLTAAAAVFLITIVSKNKWMVTINGKSEQKGLRNQ